MRICYIGWGNSIHLQRWMEWFGNKGHEIHLITDTDVPISIARKVKVYKLKQLPPTKIRYIRDLVYILNHYFLFIFQILYLRIIIHRTSPDILHLHTTLYPACLGAFIGFHPLVVTVWNGDVLWFSPPLKWEKIITKFVLRKADIITGISKTILSACEGLGIQKKKLYLIHWGVRLEQFNLQGDKEKFKINLGLAGCRVVLCTRSLGEIYNLETIIKTIPIVKKEIKKVIFVFSTNDTNEKRLNTLIDLVKELDTIDCALFVGKIDYPQIDNWYKAADLFVSVAVHDSGPISLIEAMACGAAPVVSNLPAIKEWIIDKWNGILVPPLDINAIAKAIIMLLNNDSLRKVYSERNWRLIKEKADCTNHMTKMEALYLLLLKKQKEMV